MDNDYDFVKWFSLPSFLYVLIAMFGGVARYLNGFTMNNVFDIRIFIASAIISGFSGFMFALLGQSLNMLPSLLYVMAGTGGFFGDQTMKFILEWVKEKKL